MLQLKLLPGTMILMLASTLSVNSVSAQTTPSNSSEMQNQMDTPSTPTRQNTQPVPTPMQMETMQMDRQTNPSSMETTTNTVSGTIRSIEGETVTVEMADGMTKQMMVSRADLERLNLREGMQISATLDAQSMASNITLAQASTTTGIEATNSQAGTTSTTTESTSSTTSTEVDATSATPTTTTETTRTTVQSTPANRPVRALW